MKQQPTRRQFIQHSAFVAGVGYFTSRAVAAPKSANEKLNVGIIGVGGRGGHNMGMVSGENIVALCDIDDGRVQRAAKKHSKAKKYHDFRKLLEQKNLDAVTVSTTDMTHAPAAVRAMQRGLHVYSEKPLAHTVFEARLMRETYLKHRDKIATQMGTQIHATDNYRRVVEAIQAGSIGNVKEAHVWCNRRSNQSSPPTGSIPVPSGLHWDLWIGPAPFRPYQKGYMPGTGLMHRLN